MKAGPPPPRLTPIAKATLAPNPQGSRSAGPGVVQWGQANGCTFRFDPQTTPRRSGAAPAPPSPRRALPPPAKRTASARRSGAGRPQVSLADEAGFDDFDDDDDDDNASISSTGPSRSAGSRGQGAPDGRGNDDEPGGRGGETGGHSQGDRASSGMTFAPAASAGQTASGFGPDWPTSPMLLALASDGSTRPLRQRALAAVGVAAPTLRSAGALGHVRTALIEAVASGALVPKVDAGSPDQNCLLPLLLLRSLRPMPPSLHAQAGIRAAAMLSMAARSRGTRPGLPASGSTP
jgi:hypothetical protein